jgi:hypothetical protein
MACQHPTCLAIVSIVAWLAVFSSATSDEAQIPHLGRVVDQDSMQPLHAEVRAWAAGVQVVPDGFCEKESSPDAKRLDAAMTSDQGSFAVRLGSQTRLYTVVACADNYQPALEENLPNTKSRKIVVPNPITIASLGTEYAKSDEFGDDVQLTVASTMNRLANLRRQNPEGFDSALSSYTAQLSDSQPDLGKQISGLGDIVRDWQGTAK